MIVLERHVTPIVSAEDYRKLKETYLTPEHGANEIEPNILHWDWAEYEQLYQGEEIVDDKFVVHRETRKRKQIKFLLLPRAISAAAWLKATEAALNYREEMRKGDRKADGGIDGRKLTLGWLPLLPGRVAGNKYTNVRTQPTLDYPHLLAAFYPLLREMDTLVAENLPKYHDYAFAQAMRATRPEVRDTETLELVDEDDLNRISDKRKLAIAEALDPWNMMYTIRGTVFSTVEFNRNIIFKAHEDGHNVDGTCVCITTLGAEYAGGRLVFPRYGYSAELGPKEGEEMPTAGCPTFNAQEAQIMKLRALLEDLRADKNETNRLTCPEEIKSLDSAIRSAHSAEQHLQRRTSHHATNCAVCQSKQNDPT